MRHAHPQPSNPANVGAPWYRAALPASLGGLLVGLMIVQWMSSSTTTVPPVYVPQKDKASSPSGGNGFTTASSFLGAELQAPGASSALSCPPTPDCPRCELCIPCINDDPAGASTGQLDFSTPLGSALRKLTADPSIMTVLETGTYNGLGSTRCIAEGLKAHGGKVITIEAVPLLWRQASKNLKAYPNVTALLGSPVSPEEMMPESEVSRLIEHGRTLPGDFVPPPAHEWRNWWRGELSMIAPYEVGLMRPLCDKYRSHVTLDSGVKMPYAFDLMVLDGAEFLGPAELQVALEACKPRYFALHDAQTFKHFFSVVKLKQPDSGYELVEEGRDKGGVGHAVFRRIA